MSENNGELDLFEDDNDEFLERIRAGIRSNNHRLRTLLNEEGFYENEANVHASDDDSDSTWVASTRSNTASRSVEEVVLQLYDARVLELHPAIDVGEKFHPGPMEEPVTSVDDICDCNLFSGNIGECLLNNYQYNWLTIDFQEELNTANDFYERNFNREPNNLQRKRMYRDIWKNLGIELEHDEQTGRYARVRLPNCSYALVRMIWPSVTGRYMGFRPY